MTPNLKGFAKLFDEKFWRFIAVGVVNTLFGTTVMFVFYNVFHFDYWFSSASNYVLGSILSYFLNKYFTFRYKKREPAVVVRFIINISVCYLAAYGAAKPLVRLLLEGASESVRDNISMCVGMCIFVGLNYLGQRFFAFREKPETDGENPSADAPSGKTDEPDK